MDQDSMPQIHFLEQRVDSLAREIENLISRNQRVEHDKAWETSGCRRAVILFLTYFFTTVVFYFIAVPYPLRNALIPTLGFYLSTLSLGFARRWWQKL